MTQDVHPGPSFFLRPTVTYLHPYAGNLTREGGFCQPYWAFSVQFPLLGRPDFVGSEANRIETHFIEDSDKDCVIEN